MKRTLDPHSCLVGLLIGIITMLVLGAVSSPRGSVGRFVASATGNHGIIVDSQTGQAWSYFFQSSGGPTGGEFFQVKTGER